MKPKTNQIENMRDEIPNNRRLCNPNEEEKNSRRDLTYGGGGGLDILLLLSLLINFGSPWGSSAFVGARNCIEGRRTSSFKFSGTALGFATVLRLGNTTEAVAYSTTGFDAVEALI